MSLTFHEENIKGEFKMIKDLVKLANALDEKGLKAEADRLDAIIQKIAIAPAVVGGYAVGLGVAALLGTIGYSYKKFYEKQQVKYAPFYLQEALKKAYSNSLERMRNELPDKERARRWAILNSNGDPTPQMIADLTKEDIRAGESFILNNPPDIPDDIAHSFVNTEIMGYEVDRYKKTSREEAVKLLNEWFMSI